MEEIKIFSPSDPELEKVTSETPKERPLSTSFSKSLHVSGVSLQRIESTSSCQELKPFKLLPTAFPESDNKKPASPEPCYTQTLCPICSKVLPEPLHTQTIQLKKLKPRFLRQIRRNSEARTLSNLETRVCIKDLHSLLQHRIDELLEEDQIDFASLQENAMKFLQKHEAEEETWQDQFDKKRNFGQKAADTVAKNAGSWKFVIAVLAFIGVWASLNLLLYNSNPDHNKSWDEYPFILLNLMLSVVAALQGPVIMMSQNRQQEMDRVESDFISKMILRGEHQTRHVNAKMDYLITNQWRRLLEIQEIQVDLLQILQTQQQKLHHSKSTDNLGSLQDHLTSNMTIPNVASMMSNFFGGSHSRNFSRNDSIIKSPIPTTPWVLEIHPDDHTTMLFRHYFSKPESDDNLLFSHWAEEGDNFYGFIKNVKVEVENLKLGTHKSRGWLEVGGGVRRDFSAKVLKRITYEVDFGDQKANLDDIFSGDGTVKLRNDFEIDHMNTNGRIRIVDIYSKEKPLHAHTFQNGDLPTRYQPSFSKNFKRSERISDFWRTNLSKIGITYSPPHQASVISIGEGFRVTNIKVEFYRPEDNIFGEGIQNVSAFPSHCFKSKSFKTKLMLATGIEFAEPIKLLDDITNNNFFNDDWKEIANVEFESKVRSVDGDVLTVELDNNFSLTGPNIYVFLSLDARTVIHGFYEEIMD
ncbi:hypothetical protein HK099_004121 [Clydaea vesicula]|uniref:DUF1003 domain-containing protein n=1 Tax=Clydaea vesicula TaxID=447962 RepID=A0AAD5XZT7_9FUNG|nr:hypothetical protein HK099_004121 [Clydaea vesicula]KAJ3389039.1 hypothetical protein HDU92_001211 [Lobulomyces angularis]